MTLSPTTPQEVVSTLVAVLHKTLLAVEPYTASHSSRVADMSIEAAVGDLLGIPEEQLTGLHIAGVLHDIGKISVPVEILVKTGKLSPEEFGLVKTHALRGYEILAPFNWPWPVAEVALQHHERIDGSGYPNGITGDLIHPMAKIIAVTDAVEAITSHRPYRAALGIDRALDVISTGSGTAYDADVVAAVVELFTKRGYVIPPYTY